MDGRPAQPGPVLTFDRGTLLLSGLGGRPALGAPGGAPGAPGGTLGASGGAWTWDARVSSWRCDAIHYRQVCRDLAPQLAEGLRDDVPAPPRVYWPKVSLPELRAEQEEALAAWMKAGCRGQVIMPTGTGKTEVALAAMARTGAATLVVAPIRDLMYQWHRRILKGLGYDAGILGDNTYNLRPVTVTTYDSASIHMAQIGDRFGLLIFDEEHHLPGPSYREAALMSPAAMRLGLTATPERYDGREADLDWLIGPVAYHMPFHQARGAALADFTVVRIPVHLSEGEQAAYDGYTRQVRHFLGERRREQPKYSWQDLCGESGKDPAARLALKAYYLKQAIENRAGEKLRVLEDIFRLHAGQKTIVFAGSNAMAMEVSRRFLLPTILSHTRKKERLAVLDGFARAPAGPTASGCYGCAVQQPCETRPPRTAAANGAAVAPTNTAPTTVAPAFPAIVANRVLDEGVDVPEAKVAVVIGGQASTRQAKQRLGRILRKTGSAPATLYEVVCETAAETERSRQRRRSDAYERTGHRRV